MSKDELDVFQDHTAPARPKSQSPDHVLPPGPPEPGEAEFTTNREPGFATVPGAGPNPSQPRD